MCCNTKLKLAKTLKELMNEKPLRKITVQDIMTRSHMTRQSFYYHFQDIYDVVEWICQHELIDQMDYHEDDTFESWMTRFIITINDDRNFYRKILNELDWNILTVRLKPTLVERVKVIVKDYFPMHDTSREKEGENFIVDFLSSSIIYYIFNSVITKKEIDDEKVINEMKYAIGCVRKMNVS